MKWAFIGLGAAIAVAAIVGTAAAAFHKHREQDNDAIDGGVVKRYRLDVPAIIESTEITEFRCTISTLAVYEPGELGNRVYKLNAVLQDGEVLVNYDWRTRSGDSARDEYRADADFMVRLQEIVTTYDLSRNNGYYHTVSGLPNMYGDSLYVIYASGERIDIHDNQSGFLPHDSQLALVKLFGVALEETESAEN